MRPSDDQIQATVERAEAAAIIVDTSTDPAPHRTPDAGPRRISAEGRRARRDSNARTTPNRRGAETLTERIIDGNELSNLNYLMLGLFAARSVGRIVVRRDGRKMGTATGFLAAPGVLITNQHVLPDDATARDSQVQFQFEVDALGDELAPVTFALRTDPAPYIDKTLDIAVVAVAPKADDGTDIQAFGWLHLDRTPGKSPEGEFLTIIQHPRGERKQICVRENKLLKYEQDGRHVLYTSDTVAGSSGSPVFNNSWDVVALHHSGVPKTRMVRGKLRWVTVDGTTVAPSEDGTIDEELDLQWLCNEGVRISAIAAALAKLSSGNELARRVLAAPIPPTPPAGPWPTPLARSRPSSSDFDEVEAVGRGRREAAADQPSLEPGLRASTIVVPIEFVVGLRAAATVATSEVPAMEVNVLERSKPRDFDDRIGYQPDFLGPDFEVPLPKLSARQQHDVTASFEGSHELKYGTFSVVMCRSRSLAYFSAANLDRSTRGTSERGSWRNDPRIAPREQIGESFYGDQRAHDDQATDFPFDRGHLTRFADARWGDLERRNGADSFHFPNCVPQHEAFNQSDSRNGIWWRLEDWAVDLGASGRLCIINGPLFDAPASKKQKGERVLQPHRPAHRDPVFNGVAVPKQFFKVIAFVGSDDKLALQAFVVTQENVLETTEAIREALTDRELSLYRVKMKVVEKLSGLSFGRLSSGGITINEADVSDVELITSLDQL